MHGRLRGSSYHACAHSRPHYTCTPTPIHARTRPSLPCTCALTPTVYARTSTTTVTVHAHVQANARVHPLRAQPHPLHACTATHRIRPPIYMYARSHRTRVYPLPILSCAANYFLSRLMTISSSCSPRCHEFRLTTLFGAHFPPPSDPHSASTPPLPPRRSQTASSSCLSAPTNSSTCESRLLRAQSSRRRATARDRVRVTSTLRRACLHGYSRRWARCLGQEAYMREEVKRILGNMRLSGERVIIVPDIGEGSTPEEILEEAGLAPKATHCAIMPAHIPRHSDYVYAGSRGVPHAYGIASVELFSGGAASY